MAIALVRFCHLRKKKPVDSINSNVEMAVAEQFVPQCKLVRFADQTSGTAVKLTVNNATSDPAAECLRYTYDSMALKDIAQSLSECCTLNGTISYRVPHALITYINLQISFESGTFLPGKKYKTNYSCFKSNNQSEREFLLENS